VRESLAEILRDAGYEVHAAADGSAALAALEARDFGLAITDIRMPGADGIAVLKRAREISPQTLVLVMTAHGSVETAVEALRAGATDYILKPVVFDELLAKVDSKYSLVLYAAKRARRIKAYYSLLGEGLLEYVGPLVDTRVQEKPLSIAMREINDELLTLEQIEA